MTDVLWIRGRIRKVENNKKQYMPLLLLADEQESMIDHYIDRGTLYVLEDSGTAIAEAVVTDEGEGVLEIKSLAVNPEYQGKGYGRELIHYIADTYKDSYSILQVGTGDSPATIPFYEKCGFTRHHVIENFFIDNYDHPIIEGGKQLRDMIHLRMILK